MLKHGMLALVLVLSLGACKDKNKDKAADKPTTTEAAKPGEGQPAADKPAEPAEPAAPAPAAGGTVDQSDPAKVVEAVFAAAAANKAEGLASLCDPAGSGDGDVKRICNSKPDDPKWGELVEYFSKGKLKGEPRVTGDDAEVDFLFGPDGTKEETMKLKKIDGKWYLASF